MLPEGRRRVRPCRLTPDSDLDEGSTIPHTILLRRVEADTNVHRFYAVMIERDLFGRVLLVRRWGRIGTRGRERPEEHPSETEAAAAMDRLAAAKRQRGYRDL